MKAKQPGNSESTGNSGKHEAYWAALSDAADVKTTSVEPMPMKNKKPVNKHLNAADNFWNDHQAEYDERAQPPKRCAYVDSHNDASPKLKDELDKKREIYKPTACQTIQQGQAPGVRCATQTLVSERDWSGPNCIMCSERRRYARNPRRRHPRYERRRNRISRVSRVSKSKRRPARRLIKIDKIIKNCSRNIQIQKNANRPNQDPRNKTSNIDLESSRYPDSSRASLSSYNSFLSVGHEPMVSE